MAEERQAAGKKPAWRRRSMDLAPPMAPPTPNPARSVSEGAAGDGCGREGNSGDVGAAGNSKRMCGEASLAGDGRRPHDAWDATGGSRRLVHGRQRQRGISMETANVGSGVARATRGYGWRRRAGVDGSPGGQWWQGEATVMRVGDLRRGCRGSSGQGGGNGSIMRWVLLACDSP
uniref:DUF834 domain-containing protein n=1 Tax=Oryza punctata TaxID=4537 RepID=A0A0E0KI03_ORYPU